MRERQAGGVIEISEETEQTARQDGGVNVWLYKKVLERVFSHFLLRSEILTRSGEERKAATQERGKSRPLISH